MGSLLQNIMGSDDDFKLNDLIIANDSLIGLKASAGSYLAATLESSTPEVRRMFNDFLNQTIIAHEGMTALSMKKDWYKPYLNPDEQITATYKQAEWVLNANT